MNSRITDILEEIADGTAPVGTARVAAAIVQRNTIVSIGTNQYKSHPFQLKYGRNADSIYLHAETDAIRRALRKLDVDDLSRCTLYITRLKYDGHRKKKSILGLSCPCAGCMRAIVQFEIKKVIFSCDDQTYKYL